MVRQNLTVVDGISALGKPKTKNFTRDIDMPASLKAALEAHKKAQDLEKSHARDAWADTGAVFATEVGEYTHPTNLNRALKGLVEWSDPAAAVKGRKDRPRKSAAPDGSSPLELLMRSLPVDHRANLHRIILTGKPLPVISPHDLRHTAATLLLRRGGDTKIAFVSKMLGHSKISTTMDVYRHVLESEKKEQAIDLFSVPKPPQNMPQIRVN